MKLKNQWKNRIKDGLVKHRAKNDTPHTLLFQQIRESLEKLSDQEKETLYLEIRKALSSSGETMVYAERIFHQFFRLYLQHSATVEGINILELGPGINVAAGIYFVLAGARRYTAIDALAAFPERPKEFYSNILEEVKNRPRLVGRNYLTQQDLDQVLKVGEQLEWNRDKIQYVTPVYAEAMPFEDESFDYIYSNASFEHFEEPDRVIREVYRTLKKNGLTIHEIDLRDHVDFSKPREFLKESFDSYNFSSPYGTNRWRAKDFEKTFLNEGFTIRELIVDASEAVSADEYASFDRYFRERYTSKELEPLSILLVASK